MAITEHSASSRVLIVESEDELTAQFKGLLEREGCAVEVARDEAAVTAAVDTWRPDVILLDAESAVPDGLEMCKRLKLEPATRLTPIVLVTELANHTKRIQGLEAGADDLLAKPVDARELVARVRSLVRIKRYTDDLDSASAIIMTLAVMIESRDGHTEGHCHRMANYATAVGRSLGLGEEELQALYRGGFLHDIGMLAISDGVLTKRGPLAPEEFNQIKAHTVVGDSLCANLRSLQAVRPIVRHHHERLDGSGYPDGLRGDRIPLVAQIVSLVDLFEAVTSDRPYQHAKPTDEALQMLRDEVQRGWRRPDLVDLFSAIVEGGRLDRFQPRPA